MISLIVTTMQVGGLKISGLCLVLVGEFNQGGSTTNGATMQGSTKVGTMGACSQPILDFDSNFWLAS